MARALEHDDPEAWLAAHPLTAQDFEKIQGMEDNAA
jgi:hypothetical protein